MWKYFSVTAILFSSFLSADRYHDPDHLSDQLEQIEEMIREMLDGQQVMLEDIHNLKRLAYGETLLEEMPPFMREEHFDLVENTE